MRFQAEIPFKDANLLDELTHDLEVQSNAELLSNLLSIASWIVAERRQGRRLASISPSGVSRELVVPLFERVAPQHELPRVTLAWTREELNQLGELLALSEPPPATEKLAKLLGSS